MHAVLIICSLVQTGWIGHLLWKVRQLGDAVSMRQDEITGILAQLETKTEDLAEGCERIDSELSTIAHDVLEITTTLNQSSREVGERIAEIAGEQEKIRRTAARPASGASAWESLRNNAGRQRNRESVDFTKEHNELVALAEGG